MGGADPRQLLVMGINAVGTEGLGTNRQVAWVRMPGGQKYYEFVPIFWEVQTMDKF